MGKNAIIGIDYSITSPAIVVHKGNEWDLTNCQFHFITDKKKFLSVSTPFHATEHTKSNLDEERFDYISEWALRIVQQESSPIVYLEGYSFGSRGRAVFNIAENGGLLKHKLWYHKVPVILIAPPSVKKQATGKGNSDKVAMEEAFLRENGHRISNLINCGIGKSPASDLVDAYYLSKIGFLMSESH